MAQGTGPMSGPSTATPSRGTFAELVTAARTSGHTQVLPILAGVGINSIPDLAGRGHLALAAGVDPSAIEDIVSATPRPQVTTHPPRQDLPERHSHQRASMRAAMDAALPNSRKRALDDLDGGIIANSTKGPLESRVRTWQDLCRAWQVDPWPISIENIRAVAASLKAARYKSALQYFEAAICTPDTSTARTLRCQSQTADQVVRPVDQTWHAGHSTETGLRLHSAGEAHPPRPGLDTPGRQLDGPPRRHDHRRHVVYAPRDRAGRG